MFEILSFYKISKLNKLKIIKKNILKETNDHDIKGLIILSPEGINGTISGSHKKIKLTITKIKNILSIDRFDIQNKFNSKILPYSKNTVQLKDEVVPRKPLIKLLKDERIKNNFSDKINILVYKESSHMILRDLNGDQITEDLKNWVIEKEYDSSNSSFSDILKQIENTEFYHRLDL